MSTAIYLTLWDLMCRRFEADSRQKRTSLAFTLFICFLIAFSRIYHGVHTYNQILLGWIFGVSLYYFFCHVVYNDIIRFCSNTDQKSCTRLFFNNGTFAFYAIYSIAIFNFCFGNVIHPAPKEWTETVHQNCSKIPGKKYEDFETEVFINFNIASTIAGSYLGLIVEQRWMGTHKYKHFNKTTPFISMLRLMVCTVIGSPTLAGLFLCPSKGIHWTTKLFFKTFIPFTLGNFFLFGCTKYFALRFNLMNTQTDEDDQQQVLDVKPSIKPNRGLTNEVIAHETMSGRERSKSE